MRVRLRTVGKPPRVRRLTRVGSVCILLLSIAAVVAIGIGINTSSTAASRPAEAPRPVVSLTVTAAAVRQTQWPKKLSATGAVAPWQEAIIGSRSSGLSIARIDVAVGDVVQRGKLLARFDTSTLQAEEAQFAAALTQAEAVAAQADANRTRALQIRGRGALSEQEVQRYFTEAITAHAQVALARAQLNAKRLQLRQADVVAPDDGVISARAATLGAVANSGQELFRIVRQGRVEWRGEFTSTQIASIAVGQSATINLPGGGTASAVVREIAPLLDERSRLGLVYADISPGSAARGGMYVDGSIVLPDSNALVVPESSVVIRDGRSIVFRLQGEGTQPAVNAQFVVVGRRQDAEVEILDGLSVGNRIVAQGAGLLSDGDIVRIEPATNKPAAAISLSVGGH